MHQLNYDTFARCTIHSGDVIDWEFLAHRNLDQAFFESINIGSFSGPQWGNLFRVNEPIYRELVREFFASFEFEASACRYDPKHLGVNFILGGKPKEMSLLKLGWRVDLYSERKSRENTTLSGLSRAETVASIRNPRVKLAHRCIETTISGRKESTNMVTEIDLYYLYCIYTEGVVCNIPYWLARYLKSIKNKSLICEEMFETRISRSFGLLTNKKRDTLSVEPPPHIFKKKSLIGMGVIWNFKMRYAFGPQHEQS
nr:hypothetical protein [Tanacetum cinerariifolium]